MLKFVEGETLDMDRTIRRGYRDYRCWARCKMVEGGEWRMLFFGDCVPSEEYITPEPFGLFPSLMEDWTKVIDEKFKKNS